MTLFDDVDQKVTNWINTGTDKVRGKSESIKISNDIREEGKKQEELYKKIGVCFYYNYSKSAEGKLKELCQEVDKSRELVVKKQKEISNLKGIKNCPNCGAEISSNSMFCNICGNRLAIKEDELKKENLCSNCGAPIEEGFAFCTSCGAQIKETKKDCVAEDGPQEDKIKETGVNCPYCGKVSNSNNVFCTGCGMKIVEIDKADSDNSVIISEKKQEKRCPECNAVIEDNQKFCISCGLDLEQIDGFERESMDVQNICPNCGKEIMEEDLFCVNCGTRLVE